MKMPIEWHENCLANQRESLWWAAYRLDHAKAEHEMLSTSVEFYERQIAEAKHRGMDTFDRDRLLVVRKRESAE